MECVLPYEAGTLTAFGCAMDTKTEVSDCLKTADVPAKMELHCWDDKEDILQVEVFIKDNNNTPVWEALELLHVKVEGGGELLGLENGNLADNTSYTLAERCTQNGRLIIYIRRKDTTPITLTVSSDKLPDAVLVI